MDNDSGSNDLSKYNEASLQIMRLHNLWTKIEEKINKGDLTGWKFQLDSVWRELYADVFHTSKPEDVIKQNETHKKLISKSKVRASLYESLNKRHEFLKKLQDKVGKGGTYIDETEDDID